MMKKTLVALAAVAATGGAFAQATMTGAIAFGFQSDTTSSNITTSGFGIEDSEINFAVSEEIEGLGKLTAGTGYAGGGRSVAVTTNDTFIAITLAGGAKIKMASEKGAEYLSGGIAGAGANFEADMTAISALASRTTNDTVAITLPVTDAVYFTYKHSEADVVIGTGSAANLVTPVQRYNTGVLGYKAGALVAEGQFRSYDNQVASSATYVNTKNRFSVSYDLGVAKIGAGVDQNTYTYGNTKSSTMVGATVPMGAVTLGVQMLSVNAAGNSSSSSNYTRSGALAGAQYNLSKRTYVTGQYWTGDVGGTSNQTGYLFSMYNTF